MNIGKEIIRLRRLNGLTQEALAERIGLSRQAVAKWEKGDAVPELEKLVAMGRLFRISLDHLVRGDEPCGGKGGPVRYDPPGLAEFICEAKRSTYAAKAPEADPCRLKSHDLCYEKGDFSYRDSYFGGERFVGEEAVWKEGVPLWSMNYMGRVLGEAFSGDFLKESLMLVSPGMPYRGPGLYKEGDYTYHCAVRGDWEWFRGEEEIFCRDERVYECLFHGGSIGS